jgi:endogenous inhibitor of DNA gyrase (YacG/DUF329 family)
MEKRTVKCPQCKNPALFSPENPYRPFCSERCRLIDLGEWASESYRVPDKEKISIQELGKDSDNDAENE